MNSAEFEIEYSAARGNTRIEIMPVRILLNGQHYDIESVKIEDGLIGPQFVIKADTSQRDIRAEVIDMLR